MAPILKKSTQSKSKIILFLSFLSICLGLFGYGNAFADDDCWVIASSYFKDPSCSWSGDTLSCEIRVGVSDRYEATVCPMTSSSDLDFTLYQTTSSDGTAPSGWRSASATAWLGPYYVGTAPAGASLGWHSYNSFQYSFLSDGTCQNCYNSNYGNYYESKFTYSESFDSFKQGAASETIDTVAKTGTKYTKYYFFGYRITFDGPRATPAGNGKKKKITKEKTTPKQYTLTGIAIDATTGSEIPDVSHTSSTVNYGSYTTVPQPSPGNNYVFVCWKDSSSGNCKSTGANSHGIKMTSHKNVYAVYQPQRTLTGKAVDNSSGASLSSIMSDVTNTVPYNTRASITRRTAEGYTFVCWKNSNTGSCTDNNTTYIKNNLTSDTIVYAAYDRIEFAGFVSATGKGTLGNSSQNTGWVQKESNPVPEVAIDCVNTGCNAEWSIKMKKIKGDSTASTGYRTGTSTNNGDKSWVPIAPIAYSFSPSNTEEKTLATPSENSLTPGQKRCKYLEFRPYGIQNNNWWATPVGVCVKINVSTFEGKISASGDTSGNTGWLSTSNNDKPKVFSINNCNTKTGCKAKLSHALRRTSGIGSTSYYIKREVNLITSTQVIQPIQDQQEKTIVSSTNFDLGTDKTKNNTENIIRTSEEYTLYPGMVVCETLSFKPSNDTTQTVNYAHVKGCIHAYGDGGGGDPDPDDPFVSDDDALLSMKVKNNNVNRYSEFQDVEVYAKPGDGVSYKATYNPRLQYTYFLIPQKIKVNNGTIYPSGNTINEDESKTLGKYYNNIKGSSLKNWRNAFSIYNDFGSTNYDFCRTAGDATKLDPRPKGNQDFCSSPRNSTDEPEYHNHTIEYSEVGKTLIDTAETNRSNTTQTTPSQVKFEKYTVDDKDISLGTVITNPISDAAQTKIPYNFINTTDINRQKLGDANFYAGEEKEIPFFVTTHPKGNSYTLNEGDPDYATVVRKAKTMLYFCVGTDCDRNAYQPVTDAEENQTFQNNSGTNGKNEAYITNKTITMSIPDRPAGTKICFRSSVYPASSGADTNIDSDIENGYKTASGVDVGWANSSEHDAENCFKIAKKPSIQIWGGNIYTRGNIATATSEKDNLAGYIPHQTINSDSRRFIFGSWGELGIISGGKVKQMASAASTGYAANNNGTLLPNPYAINTTTSEVKDVGGSEESPANFCKHRTFLTIANFPCGNATNPLGSTSSAESAADEKNAIVEEYAYGGEANEDGEVDISIADESKKKKEGVYYHYGGSKSLTIKAANIPENTIQVVHSDNKVTVTGNIIYDGVYNSFDGMDKNAIMMPKTVIYAKNIVIGCNVERIDAVLIADEVVVTCDNFENDFEHAESKAKEHANEEKNSHQLVIHGAIIANKLVPNRTYGAASGINSIVPAEIINFDPTLYLWGGDHMDTNGRTNTNLETTLMREMAPRD